MNNDILYNRQTMLRYAALELICNGLSRRVCGGGSTLSEYEIYFHYALQVM
jgi:hypothetical protein